MKKWFFITVILLGGCARMNEVAFINDNTIDSYKYDEWEGEQQIELPDSFHVAQSEVYEVVLESQMEGEAEPKKIWAVYIGDLADIAKDTIIVYCHGQSKHMDAYWNRVKLLAYVGGKHRYGVLEMDYRGFGLSEGTPSEEGMYADVEACLQWLKSMGAEEQRVVIYGFSLGSAPATETAAYFSGFKPSKLILESPFASSDNLAQEATLINFQAEYVTDLDLNNAEKIKDVNQPLLWMHGTADDYIAISNGELIYKNHRGVYKEAHRVEGAKHGVDGVPSTMGYQKYLDTIEQFIQR